MTERVAPLTPETLVAIAYRAILRREPDAGGLAAYAAALRGGHDLMWLLASFLASDEYRTLLVKNGPPLLFPLDRAPAMIVDTEWDAAERQAVWDHIARIWSAYGETEPHWSVITDDRFRADTITDAANMALFQDSGPRDVERLDAWLSRNGIQANGVCAEYGCGVGRVTTSLARRFERVVAFDISAPHLQVAHDRLDADRVLNVDFVHVRSPADLDRLTCIDLFYSVIVLQHNPPPVVVDILECAFSGLNPGGIAYFQLTTYGLGYSFSAHSYQNSMNEIKEMEIHFVPQHIVFQIAEKHGLSIVEVQPDEWTGNRVHWISTTFLFRKLQSVRKA